MRAASDWSRNLSEEGDQTDVKPQSHTDDPEGVRVFPEKTFGVEYEFLVVCDRASAQPSTLGTLPGAAFPFMSLHDIDMAISDRSRASMVNMLRNAGISCNDYHCQPEDFDQNSWNVKTDGSVAERGELCDDQASITFANGQTHTFQPGERETLFLASVEVTSRVLPFDEASLDEMDRALAVLREFPTLVNYTCGFHVHVGQGAHGFDLRTLKNIFTLGCAAQKQINELHSKDRINKVYCQMPTMAFEPEERTLDAMVDRIDGLPTVQALIDFVHTTRPDREQVVINPVQEPYRAYNFMNLGAHMPKQTIEFRQADGTLDGAAARRWVMFVCALVMRAQVRQPSPFADAIMDVQSDPDLGVLELFEPLGMPQLRPLYRDHVANHDDVVLEDPYEGWRDDEPEPDTDASIQAYVEGPLGPDGQPTSKLMWLNYDESTAQWAEHTHPWS